MQNPGFVPRESWGFTRLTQSRFALRYPLPTSIFLLGPNAPRRFSGPRIERNGRCRSTFRSLGVDLLHRTITTGAQGTPDGNYGCPNLASFGRKASRVRGNHHQWSIRGPRNQSNRGNASQVRRDADARERRPSSRRLPSHRPRDARVVGSDRAHGVRGGAAQRKRAPVFEDARQRVGTPLRHREGRLARFTLAARIRLRGTRRLDRPNTSEGVNKATRNIRSERGRSRLHICQQVGYHTARSEYGAALRLGFQGKGPDHREELSRPLTGCFDCSGRSLVSSELHRNVSTICPKMFLGATPVPA